MSRGDRVVIDAETVDGSELIERVGFEADPTMSPLANLDRLVEEADDDVAREAFVDAAFRSIAGYGPDSAKRGLDRIEARRAES